MIDKRLDEMLEILRMIKRENPKIDYIPLIHLPEKIIAKNPEWTEEEIKNVLNELRDEGKIRITDNFKVII